MEQILDALTVAFITIASSSILYVANRVAAFIKENTKKVKNEEHRNEINDTVDKLESLVRVAVEDLEVTVGQQLREDVKDGKIERKELEALKPLAKEKVFDGLTDEFIRIASESVGNVSGYVESLIEIKLKEIKNQINSKEVN